MTSANTTSGFDGNYITGMAGNGTFTVTVSASGYISQTFTVTFVNGVTQTLNVALVPNIPFSASGTVTDAQTGLPIKRGHRFSLPMASPTIPPRLTHRAFTPFPCPVRVPILVMPENGGIKPCSLPTKN
jgi:hypothetical protein